MIKHAWVMPEERDEKFSNALLERITASADSFGIKNFELALKEQYTIEDKPHYHLHVEHESCSSLKGSAILAIYAATSEGKEYKGTIDMTFKADGRLDGPSIGQIMTAGIFFLYDECVREYYPEWKTTYQEIKFFPILNL